MVVLHSRFIQRRFPANGCCGLREPRSGPPQGGAPSAKVQGKISGEAGALNRPRE